MDKDVTRDERQTLAIQKFIDAKGRGTFEFATAFGKTRVALRLIQYLRRTVVDRKVIIVVPHEYLKTQWETLLEEWKLSTNSSVHIINSFIKGKHECSLLILDECHRYAADTFSRVFDVAEYKFILGLTAMMKRLDRKQGIITANCPIIDRVTLDEARLYGFIAPYQEFNLGIELDTKSAIEYEEYFEFYKNCMGTFQWDFGLMKKCLVSHKPYRKEFDGKPVYFGSACEKLAIEYGWMGNSPREAHEAMMRKEKSFWGGNIYHVYHPDKLMMKAINGMRMMRKMKEFIYKHPGKVSTAVEILEKLPEMKAITFAELTETADEMARLTDRSASYHSSMTVIDDKGKKLSKKKSKQYVIDKVNNGEIHRIHTARALDEGADFPEISLGIRISGSSSPTQQTQRRGRIVRKHKEKEALMINIYLKKTKEVDWLKKSQGHGLDIIWVESVDEIIENVM